MLAGEITLALAHVAPCTNYIVHAFAVVHTFTIGCAEAATPVALNVFAPEEATALHRHQASNCEPGPQRRRNCEHGLLPYLQRC
jgi:hypothetical protein